MMKKIFLIVLHGICISTIAQTTDRPFIKLVEPTKEKNSTKTARQFIIGSTCKTCNLTVNQQVLLLTNLI
jgi:N-acetylmuramoyl-L-alanine amidase